MSNSAFNQCQHNGKNRKSTYILNALTINTLKNVICGSRGAVITRPIILVGPAKITGWPTCLSAFHLCTNLSRDLIGHVRVRVLEEGLCKEV